LIHKTETHVSDNAIFPADLTAHDAGVLVKLEMICTGEEVLSGQIIDTNAAWFADLMMNQGIEMQRRITVGDRMDDLVEVFRERSLQADVILVNGGLGPTSDDLSAEAMARALGEPLVENTAWRLHLQAWFEKRGRPMPASNLKQCLLPASAILVDNPSGSAPGFRVKLNNAWLFFTPGVPSEFKPMVEVHFLAFIRDEFNIATPTRLHKLLTFGYGESLLADKLSDLAVPAGITIGYRTSMPHNEIKLFARGTDAIDALPNFITTVRSTLGEAVVAENRPSLAEEVHHLLLARSISLSIAESCTGGQLTSMLVEFPGSSGYLMQGLVTYANEAKIRVLGVPQAVIEKHGAVSTETALSMAQGARQLMDSDLAIATTGIAGPDGGSIDKPVGTVVLALASRDQVWTQTLLLSRRSRSLVRLMSCAAALDMVRRHVLGFNPVADYPFITRVE
jgi:nicotinamide-nucleotide amidase